MLAFAVGFLLALGQCLAIGPVNAEAMRRGLTGGFRPALAVELGSCIGDGLWAGLAFLGLGALFTLSFMDAAGTVLGVVLLGWLAVQGWREAVPVAAEPGGPAGQPSRLPAFWAGVLLSVVNPGSAAFWVGVGATLLSAHLPHAGPVALAQFAAGYYVALMVWSFAFAALVWQLGLRLPAVAQLWLQRATAALIGALALFSAASALRRRLHPSG